MGAGNQIIKNKILETTTQFYFASSDFNGIPAKALSEALDTNWFSLRQSLTELIQEDLIGILFSDAEINPHIIRLGFEDKQTQIKKLETQEIYHTCIYPLKKHLIQVVNPATYQTKPYYLELVLGSPQLAYRSFDLSILEQYRNDPRYIYHNDDIRGTISFSDENLPASDRVLLEHFGFSYNDNLDRAVAVFIGDLSSLTSEHQLIWKAKEVKGDYLLHPDFFRNAILGEWGERISIFDAFIEEMWVINQMARALGREPFFRQDFGEYGENKPKKFGFLIRPTLEEFNNFVLLLDQIFSENINKSFFNDIPAQEEIQRKDGKVEVRHLGTIKILDSWVRKWFHPVDWEPWDTAIAAIKQIRKMRQKPAHTMNEDMFDQEYFKKQRKLIIQAYEAIRTIRLILANHPQVKRANVKISKALQQGDIWTS